MDGAQFGPLLIKKLASCEKTIRDRSLRLLITKWLPSQHEIPDADMKKLWKGLFYCVWHADKAPVQADLIERLSSLLPELHLSLSLHYFSVFLLTMRREWPGIDHLRLDKFYLLIRRFLYHFFALLRKNSWDLELCRRCMGVLEEQGFLEDDKLQGNGVKYHIASVFLEEMRTFLPVKKEVIELVLGPFLSCMEKSPDKLLLVKIKGNVFDVMLKMGKRLLEVKKSDGDMESGDSDDMVVLGTIALTIGFSSKFYALGSSTECIQGNRKVLFGLHEEFLKLEKDMISSNIQISFPVVDDADEEEVPKLVPFVNDLVMDDSNVVAADSGEKVANGSIMKGLKKCKKSKKAKNKKNSPSTDGVAMDKENESMGVVEMDDSNVVAVDSGENVANGSIRKSLKKCKKSKKAKNKKNNPSTDGVAMDKVHKEDERMGVVEGENWSDGNLIQLNDTLMSNLQMQFEKVATEEGLGNDGVASACDLQKLSVNGTVPKKRKRTKSMDGKKNPASSSQVNAESGATANTVESRAKKVRFSMKNNLVWKPNSPLPPQSMRIPPTLTPRGSALKQGVPPGPIREMPPAAKRRVKSLKRGRKAMKNIISPALKRRMKLKSQSA
ncbi:hypothetical protein HS088_TW09G00981 [Tripterygium wilfordii]|uniref:Ribosomal RNA processing protein 1 B n=1 Tax=Tripterygium wilfordii TaxID=458696 RepID=A0A7J7D9J7_TRIWF|nr:ribosomal RNA processing protein 1 homolog [Tripterygium wilfordii]KAF5742919.1 hypothetical protein HS088_TW09G00981 [Tripterygium wilfordii]